MAKTGRKLSESTKEKIKKNHSHYWLGKKRKGVRFSDEAIKNIGDAQRKYYENGGIGHNSGHKHTEETKNKIRLKLKGKKLSLDERKKRSIFLPRGKNHHNWKGGVSNEYEKIRHSIELKLWRDAVFARDNWTCQKYFVRGVKLHAHHIKNFSEHKELRSAINNGITLSDRAHKEFHKKYGKKNNNEEQIKEFLNLL
jgi:hypothetical protein